MKKRIVSLLIIGAMAVSLVACGSNSSDYTGDIDTSAEEEAATSETSGMPAGYNETSAAIYEDVLGDYAAFYEAAQEAETVSERFALIAQAEARLLESGIMIPTTANGGSYQISRVAPYTVPSVLWGIDGYRYHQMLVTTELINAADYAEMRQTWSELKGTGTYEEWVKSYLAEKGYTIKEDMNYSYKEILTMVNDYPMKIVILFGSWADGSNRADSDIEKPVFPVFFGQKNTLSEFLHQGFS